jgi:hypothetical protein
MKLVIEISLDDAALSEDTENELRRILLGVPVVAQSFCRRSGEAETAKLFDSNGNSVGTMRVEK